VDDPTYKSMLDESKRRSKPEKRAKLSEKEEQARQFMLMGLNEREARIAAGLEDESLVEALKAKPSPSAARFLKDVLAK